MSYTKHTWEDNELITADKLNNIEEGVSNMIFLVTGSMTWDEDAEQFIFDGPASATSLEIKEAFQNGKLPVLDLTLNNAPEVAPSEFSRCMTLCYNYEDDKHAEFNGVSIDKDGNISFG